jgi:hypothetical protein
MLYRVVYTLIDLRPAAWPTQLTGPTYVDRHLTYVEASRRMFVLRRLGFDVVSLPEAGL